MKLLMATVAATAILVSAPAFADCQKEMMKVTGELKKDKRVAEGYASGVISNGDIRRLRAAAMIFRQAGLEDRCTDVVAGMKELANKSVDAYDKRRMALDKDKAAKARRDAEREKRMAYLKNARPIEGASMSMESVLGTTVHNTSDETLGTIEDVTFKDGRIQSVIVARGGFLGFGESHYRVDWSQLKVTTDGETIVLAVSEKMFEQMPKVEKEDGRWHATSADGKADDDKRNTMKKTDKKPAKSE